ncbi:MAG: putative quinol monooxygenase [Acidobacteriota bacterium]
MTSPIVVLAHFRAKSEYVAKLRALLTDLIRATRREPGCLQYDLHVATDDPTAFVLIEQWASPAALEAHLAQPHTQKALRTASEWLAEPVQVSRWTTVELDQLTPGRRNF